mgnify:FL=1
MSLSPEVREDRHEGRARVLVHAHSPLHRAGDTGEHQVAGGATMSLLVTLAFAVYAAYLFEPENKKSNWW